MMYLQSRQILIIFMIIINSFLLSQNCQNLNPDDYGDCESPLGYIWTGNNCIFISGCDMGEDADFFFSTYEECSLTCFNDSSLGDLNDDNFINIVDVVQLVNLILDNDSYNEVGDLNFDGVLNVVDIVSLVNLILNLGDSAMPEECFLEPDSGPCFGYMPMYYFNQDTQSCEMFIYGGCMGVIPFESLAECQGLCE